ncbi:MAG: hypothetical protein ACRDJW_00510 [Thermomicrobiales bacterium]
MDAYRDPDDMPVDPDADDVATAAAPRHPRSPLRPAHPDADRPARLGDHDELFVHAVEDAFDRREFEIDSPR